MLQVNVFVVDKKGGLGDTGVVAHVAEVACMSVRLFAWERQTRLTVVLFVHVTNVAAEVAAIIERTSRPLAPFHLTVISTTQAIPMAAGQEHSP